MSKLTHSWLDHFSPSVCHTASDSVKYVVANLMEVADKWSSIGLFLGIPYKRIEICKLEDTLEERITKMVELWLSQQYNTDAFGLPSWRKLAEAVASSSGGCHYRLASEIARDHPLSYTTGMYCQETMTVSSMMMMSY